MAKPLPPACRRRRGPGILIPLLLPFCLAGCGPPSPQGWRQHDLPDAGLPQASQASLARCARLLQADGALGQELARPADPSNFGVRRSRDALGRPIPHSPRLIVLHETVLSAPDTIRLFQTPHPRDEDQVSYHMLIDRAGQRLRIVPDARRAYGAGQSAFGDATVRYRSSSAGSVNEMALHLSLETPADGRGDSDGHSGYSEAQYRTAAAQVLLWQARYGIPLTRLTTHAAVDRSRSRYDPRSFRWDRFDPAYRQAARRCALTAYDNGRASW
ncbi:MAG: peptidoglycan recognition family protein [Synechococcaceae cyanobacterium]|nr:peptidoglycan recognition family protein [Synechococcaceae cyanobacterium]